MTTRLRRFSQKDLPLSQQTGAILLPDSVVSSDNTTLTFAGFDAYGYEVSLQESLLWLQESFAGEEPPEKAVKGQLWFNTTNKLIYAYDGDDYLNGGDSTNINNWVTPINIDLQDLTTHINDLNNPHQVTKAQIGLPNVLDATQLVAANNLSDLTNVFNARQNLDVYDKAYVDNNFNTISNTSAMINTALNNTTLFLKATENNNYDKQFILSHTKPIYFTQISSTPLNFYNGEAIITTNDITGDLNIKVGSLSTPGTNTGDKYLSSTDGAALFAMKFKGTNGSIVLSARNIGTQGSNLEFYNKLEITEDSVTWLGQEILTRAGAHMIGSIYADTTNLDIGSMSSPFNNVYSTNTLSTNILVDEITHNKSSADVNFSNSSLVAFKNGDNVIQYTTVEKLKNIVKVEIGGATTSIAGTAKIASQTIVNTPNNTNNTDIVTPQTFSAALPTCKAWVSFNGMGVGNMTINGGYNVISVSKVSTGVYTIIFDKPLKDGYCVMCNNTAGSAGTNGSIYSDNSVNAWEKPPSNKTNSSVTIVFGNGTDKRDVYEANVIIYGEFA